MRFTPRLAEMREDVRRQNRIAYPLYNRIIWIEGLHPSVERLIVTFVSHFNKRCNELGLSCSADTDAMDASFVCQSNGNMPGDLMCTIINDVLKEITDAMEIDAPLPPFRNVPYPEKELLSKIERRWCRNAETRERIDRVVSKMRKNILRKELTERSDLFHSALIEHANRPSKKVVEDNAAEKPSVPHVA